MIQYRSLITLKRNDTSEASWSGPEYLDKSNRDPKRLVIL